MVVATAEGDETTGRMALRTRGCCGSEGLGDPPGNLTALTELALTGEGVRVPRDGGVGVVGRVTRVLVGEGEGEGDTVLVPPAAWINTGWPLFACLLAASCEKENKIFTAKIIITW